MTSHRVARLLGILLLAIAASATIFGTVRGLIHDPQHRPVQGSRVILRAEASDWTQTTTSDSSGEFHFDAVPDALRLMQQGGHFGKIVVEFG